MDSKGSICKEVSNKRVIARSYFLLLTSIKHKRGRRDDQISISAHHRHGCNHVLRVDYGIYNHGTTAAILGAILSAVLSVQQAFPINEKALFYRAGVAEAARIGEMGQEPWPSITMVSAKRNFRLGTSTSILSR